MKIKIGTMEEKREDIERKELYEYFENKVEDLVEETMDLFDCNWKDAKDRIIAVLNYLEKKR